LQTKEDKKAIEDGNNKKSQKRQFINKVGLSDDLNSGLFGFNTQVNKPREPREEREPREHREPREPREHREPRENRGPRDNNNNNNNNNRGGKDNRGPKDNNRGPKAQ